jgi:hypothetical protein
MKRLPLVLSVTAVLVSVLGATSLGRAAGGAVGQTVEKAKATAGLGTSAAQPTRRGPRGPRGPRGRRGPPGPAGAALAFGRLSAEGTLDAASSKSLTSATRLGPGRYCIVPGVTVRNAVASLGQQGFGVGVDVGLRSASCPNGIEVRTFDGDGFLVDNETFIVMN